MAIYLNSDSKIIVQGMTGGMGAKHTTLMVESGANIVGGVNARKAGTTVAHKDRDDNDIDLPVFGSVAEAMEKTGADVSIAFREIAEERSHVLEELGLEPGSYLVATAHRAGNVDRPERLV